MSEVQTNINETRTVPRMLSVKDAAKLTGMAEHAIRNKLRANKIVHIRTGNKFLINRDKLIDYLNTGEQWQQQ